MKKIWTTKDGGDVEITNMEDSHLINTIKLLERNAENGVEVVFSLGWGEKDYPEFDSDVLYGKHYLDTVDSYKYLKQEAKKRGLSN